MSRLSTIPVADTNIEVGTHVTVQVGGLTFNMDTIWASLVAGVVVVGLGFFVAAKSSATKPTKVQLAWEELISYVSHEVQGTMGRASRYVIELAVALFVFILVANWFELIPSGENPKYLPAPTADVNLTYALALLVVVGVHYNSMREKGFRGYFTYYAHGPKILIPLTVIEEIVKPFTLALRLFGNIFAGGIMLAIIGLIPIWGFWAPSLLWKAFDMFIGLIQAFIFALLTIIYFGMMSGNPDEHAEHEAAPAGRTDRTEASESAQPELTGAH
jgi:F-type H+-transporting ATPase subunit a